MNPLTLAQLLTETASDPAALEYAYDHVIQAVLAAPLWSADDASGVRIPWRSARDAATHPSLRVAFSTPGLYLFGSGTRVPLYLGMTTTPLWKRLRGRYVSGQRSQCQLAVDYEQSLLAHGLEGFPDEVRNWYRRSFGGSTVRLKGAVSFAQFGIHEVWFTVFPISDPASVRPIERVLIPIASAWNRSHGHPPLINVQDA